MPGRPLLLVTEQRPMQATIDAAPEMSAPSAATGAEFRRKAAAGAVAAQHDEAEVFVPTVPKSDATLAMLENAVKGQLVLQRA